MGAGRPPADSSARGDLGPRVSDLARPDRGGDASRHFARRLALVAYVVLLVGVAASLAAATLWRSSVRARERQSFQTTATNVSGRLETQLRRDTDFVRVLRAVLAMEPSLSASGFAEWAARLEERGHEQHGMFGAIVVKAVPARELTAFLAHRNADPAFRRLVGGRLVPVPRSGRSRYCLLAAGSAPVTYDEAFVTSLQEDWCDPGTLVGSYRQNGTTRAQFTQAISESGQFAVYAVNALPGVSTLALEVAVYRRGAPLASSAQRRAAVTAWVVGSFDVPTLIRAALGAHRRLVVSLYHRNPGLPPEYIGSLGHTSPHPLSYRATLPLDGSWIIDVAGLPVANGPSADVQALVVLLAGLLGTFLLAALVAVLARARERALAMVREKTAQLRHQALHDALTGLPNRVLALDRAAQMLAQGRRRGQPVAALYVDVDGFKEVNDSHGHAAGDELLRTVAARLEAAVREGETAARFGGDEFVVFMQGARADGGPEQMAKRLLAALRESRLGGGDGDREGFADGPGASLSFTVSIGVASGLPDHVDELLREADVALYQAKAQGKDRCVVYAPERDTRAGNGAGDGAAHAERRAASAAPIAPGRRLPA